MAKSECFNENPECKYYEQGCHASTHHLYYPRRNYRNSLERQFRELPENKVQLCRSEHDELHLNEDPPDKPSRAVMLGAIALESDVA